VATALLDYEQLEATAAQLRPEFERAAPFPHVVIDGFLSAEIAESVLSEFDNGKKAWNHYHHYNEKKLALTQLSAMGPRTQELIQELQSRPFLDVVEALTGVSALIADPELDGAGLHQVRRGGFLNVHADFLSHTTNRQWSRQINLLIYFNPEWRSEWGGNLELWNPDVTRCVQSIEPRFNRCVIFHTREHSYHGHPHRLACPENVSRRSLALYYFRNEESIREVRSTDYRPRPEDPPMKRALIAADRGLLRAYSLLKRYGGLRDRMLDRILRYF
jgi:Rps23 Pro-64 3,4-dihydroxylase Tpa1-like proline 4-hydroxylase